MREILFRGKRVDNGEWVNGYFIKANHHWHEHGVHEDWIAVDTIQNGGWCNVRGKYAVIPETVGQYTGLNIGNEKLFEGDIVEWHEDYDDKWGYSQTAVGRSVVIWDKENFCWAFETNAEYIQPFNDWNWNSSYIIGNIHDNPELLKEREGK